MSRSRARRIVKWGLLGAIVLMLAGGGFVEYTTQPEFCASCHNMVPYVDSWRHSSHNTVPCIDCHYEPGIAETLEGKFKALSQVAKYVTATEGTKPWAEVSDTSCMRSGCHEMQNLAGPIQFGRVKFDHAPHLLELRRGKKLRCTSCHSQIVQGEHLTVTKSTCFTCHFKESGHTEAGKPVSDCFTCHGPPEELVQLGGGKVFRHQDYIARGVDCKQCHADVVRGTGEVPKHRCGTCHGVQEHLDRYDDTIFLHRQHVTDHKVDCIECHTEIVHSLPPRAEHGARGDCARCHDRTHSVEAGMFAGVGAPWAGVGVEPTPSPMFLARVTCEGCHVKVPGGEKHSDPFSSSVSGSRLACMTCHGTAVAPLMESWQAEVKASLAQVKELRKAVADRLAAATQSPATQPPASARDALRAADELLAYARTDGSQGVHNIEYMRKVLALAVARLNEAWSATAAPGTGSAEAAPAVRIGSSTPSQESCATVCHSGVESWPIKLAGAPAEFDHGKHVLSDKADCGDCHETAIRYEEHPKAHGRPKVGPQDCGTCHHDKVQSVACATCHPATQALLSGHDQTGADRQIALMPKEECASCHWTAGTIDRDEIGEACNGCHDGTGADDYADWRKDWADGALREAFQSMLDAEVAMDARSAILGDLAPLQAKLGEARARLEYLRTAGPMHNVFLAEEILDEANKTIREVREKVRP